MQRQFNSKTKLFGRYLTDYGTGKQSGNLVKKNGFFYHVLIGNLRMVLLGTIILSLAE